MSLYYNRRTMMRRRKQLRNGAPSAEKVLWSRLRRRGVGGVKFRRQFSVGRYVLDFYAPSLHLAIEVDGDSHASPEAIEYDAIRTRYLEGFKIMVVRVTNDQVFRKFDRVVERLEEVIVERRREWCGEGAEDLGAGGEDHPLAPA
jgi:very-short-patch-repair endonuclease